MVAVNRSAPTETGRHPKLCGPQEKLRGNGAKVKPQAIKPQLQVSCGEMRSVSVGLAEEFLGSGFQGGTPAAPSLGSALDPSNPVEAKTKENDALAEKIIEKERTLYSGQREVPPNVPLFHSLGNLLRVPCKEGVAKLFEEVIAPEAEPVTSEHDAVDQAALLNATTAKPHRTQEHDAVDEVALSVSGWQARGKESFELSGSLTQDAIPQLAQQLSMLDSQEAAQHLFRLGEGGEITDGCFFYEVIQTYDGTVDQHVFLGREISASSPDPRAMLIRAPKTIAGLIELLTEMGRSSSGLIYAVAAPAYSGTFFVFETNECLGISQDLDVVEKTSSTSSSQGKEATVEVASEVPAKGLLGRVKGWLGIK